MEKSFEWRDHVSFKQCARTDGSIYGTADSNQCRIGVETSISDVPKSLSKHEVFGRLNKSQTAKLNGALVDFHETLTKAGYQEDAMADWRDGQERLLTELNYDGGKAGKDGKMYTGDMVVAKAEAQLTKMKETMVDQMPTHLDNGAGQFTEASLSMKPNPTSSQLKWKDPVLGDSYGFSQYTREEGIKKAEKDAAKADKLGDKKAGDIYRQRAKDLEALPEGATIVKKNGVAASKFSQFQEGNAEKMLKYKEQQGANWPAKPIVQPSKAEVDALVKNNPQMWTSGLNTQNKARGRDDGFDVYELGNKNPSPQALAARDRKNRAMAESYLEHGGKSPVTGQDIKLPKSDIPTTKTVVDHVKSYRDIVKENPGKSIFELDAIANTRSNFVIVEADLNNSKGDRSWNQTASNLSKSSTSAAVRKSVTDNWNDNGSRVTLSEKQYRQRFGNTDGFTDPKQRQAVASAHEQRRLAGIFGVKQSEMVPTSRRKTQSVNDTFTPPKGTVARAGTGGKATPVPKTKSVKPTPPKVSKVKTSKKIAAKKEEPKTQPKAKYAGWTKSRFDRAIQRAYDSGNDAEVAKLRAAMGNL
jgi:hypothetical protein